MLARRRNLVTLSLSTASLAAALALVLYLATAQSIRSDWPLPLQDKLAYRAHASLGTALNRLGASPSASAVQWIKAAAHARSVGELERAARGLGMATQRSIDANRLEANLCADVLRGGSPPQIAAVRLDALRCNPDQVTFSHATDGAPIRYATRPPSAGPHYAAPYPSYGVVEQPVQPCHWVHNLEHGAIVLLYNCAVECHDLVMEIKGLYASLPPGRNAPGGRPRLLARPYADMDQRIALVAWGQVLDLDSLRRERLTEFYDAYVDRGPECRNLSCPN